MSILAILFFVTGYLYYIFSVPISQLNNVKLETPLRIYTADHHLIAEFGEHKRIPVLFEDIPSILIKAFLSAEDSDFYTNNGIQIRSLLRAAWPILTSGQIHSGGSTITMQVARNFFLKPDRVFSRKLKEMILALKINNNLSKNNIITLYLNKIYLGHRAYGIESAAQIYYGRSIRELNLAQTAMIAGLPKAPSAYNPISNPTRALSRRNWILGRMLALKFITSEAYHEAVQQKITAKHHHNPITVHAPHLAEMVRQDLLKKYGEGIYKEGYQVYTTITQVEQNLAEKAILKGLIKYTQKQMYQGPIQQMIQSEYWDPMLKKTADIDCFKAAIITEIGHDFMKILLKSGQIYHMPWTPWPGLFMKTIHKLIVRKPASPETIFRIGDLIWVQCLNNSQYQLAQIPTVQAVLLSMNPKTGQIYSLIGGFNFNQSRFNRATDARRQIGSLIKPFIYSAALDQGMTAATLINDAPIMLNAPDFETYWRPQNDDRQFRGLISLRQSLYQSRNLASIRILEKTGIQKARQYLTQFGFEEKTLTQYLSLALGAMNVTPMHVLKAYGMLANGGYLVQPYWIHRIIFPDKTSLVIDPPTLSDSNTKPNVDSTIDDSSIQLNMCPRVNYIINSILKDAINLGTARGAKVLKRKDFCGKTGTTNHHKDVWFVGFNPVILTLVWLGKDNATALGANAFGSSLALPIWLDYMKPLVRSISETHLSIPNGLIYTKMNQKKQTTIASYQEEAVFELFRTEYASKILDSIDLNVQRVSLESLF
ncbi:MAG: PBP1A family penicillin-binding protein [Endozoicomonadaceae bacterium]|nr:PBP1A family penicillin-binding protein [Endozoicomonadaceae bacterium]